MAERRRTLASVRVRVTAAATLAVAITLLASGLLLVATQQRALRESLDESLGQVSDQVADELRAGRLPAVASGFGDDDAMVQAIDATGTIVLATGAAPDDRALVDTTATSGRTITDSVSGDTQPYRILARTVDTTQGRMTVIVAASEGDLRESRSTLVGALAVGIPLVVVLLGALVWVVVGRTLAPVDAIRATVESLSGRDLDRRVVEPGTGDEIDRLAVTLNELLTRIEQATDRQRQFVADASHELRSPLTRMRTSLEVDVAHPSLADADATRQSVLDDTLELQRLVDDLLEVARLDAHAPLARRPLDLDDVVLSEASLLDSPGITVDVRGVSAAAVNGDRDHLRRVVRNLLDNAVAHAASRVVVTLAEDEAANTSTMVVADDGPGVPLADRDRVFERFTRLDAARERAVGGTGLGLAIVHDIVEAHDGTVHIEDNHPGARFIVTLPSA